MAVGSGTRTNRGRHRESSVYVTGMLDNAYTALAGEESRVCAWLDAPRNAMDPLGFGYGLSAYLPMPLLAARRIASRY